MYVNGKGAAYQMPTEIEPRFTGSVESKSPLRLGVEDKRFFEGGAVDEFRVSPRVLNAEEAALLAAWNLLECSGVKPAAPPAAAGDGS